MLACDLASLRSVRDFTAAFAAADLPPLHAIVGNAGLQVVSGIQRTEDGVEKTFGVNHLGHFALIEGLREHPRRARPDRDGRQRNSRSRQVHRMPHPRYASAADARRTRSPQ